MISWLLYQQNKIERGLKKPIVIGSARDVTSFIPDDIGWTVNGRIYQFRSFEVYIYNRSAIPESVVFTDFRVWWPRKLKVYYMFETVLDFEMPPHRGGNMPILITTLDLMSKTEDEAKAYWEQTSREKCFIRFKGQTLSGQKLSYFGWVDLPAGFLPSSLDTQRGQL